MPNVYDFSISYKGRVLYELTSWMVKQIGS